ncbi:MAG TPA: acylphosphatase [Longimicrobiaceae bacterium]
MSRITGEATPQRTERFLIHGRVQGVGFRWWARQEANALGISGFVRNRRDGVVEVVARGTVDALDDFASRLRRGPPAARVDRLEREPADVAPTGGFEIAH